MSKLTSRLPLEEAVKISDRVRKDLLKDPDNLIVTVAGSIRRRKEDIGDIDIVAARRDFELNQGKIQKFDFEEVPVQVYQCCIWQYEAHLLFLTGCAEFNIMSRVEAKKRRLALSQYGLRDEHALLYRCETEILYVLGLTQFVDPESRTEEAVHLGR